MEFLVGVTTVITTVLWIMLVQVAKYNLILNMVYCTFWLSANCISAFRVMNIVHGIDGYFTEVYIGESGGVTFSMCGLSSCELT
jgi:hypothetical protein